MVLVANKVDLMHLRKITRDQGKEMATKYNVGGHACTGACLGHRAMCVSLYAIPPAVPVLEIGLRPPAKQDCSTEKP